MSKVSLRLIRSSRYCDISNEVVYISAPKKPCDIIIAGSLVSNGAFGYLSAIKTMA